MCCCVLCERAREREREFLLAVVVRVCIRESVWDMRALSPYPVIPVREYVGKVWRACVSNHVLHTRVRAGQLTAHVCEVA